MRYNVYGSAVYQGGYYMKKLMFIILPLVIISCTFEQKEYVSVYIENHTAEDILVYAGMNIIIFSVPSATIKAGTSQSVLVEKGEDVKVSGKKTETNYGSKTFFRDATWVVL